MGLTRVYAISADREFISALKSAAENLDGVEIYSFSDVVYAINSLGEIEPSWIVLNAQEFPRHWKVVAQVLANPEVLCLWSPAEMLESESSKARALGIKLLSAPPGQILRELGLESKKITTKQRQMSAELEGSLVMIVDGRIRVGQIHGIDGASILLSEKIPHRDRLPLDGILILGDGESELPVKLLPDPDIESRMLLANIPPELSQFL